MRISENENGAPGPGAGTVTSDRTHRDVGNPSGPVQTRQPDVASQPPAVTPAGPVLAQTRPPGGTGRTRVSGVRTAVIGGVVVLALLLVFILENTRPVKVSYFGARGTIPLGVALLLAVVGGVLLSGALGSLRIWQLRHRLNNPQELGNPDVS
jgi:lipopolysaccharide assembly protein A